MNISKLQKYKNASKILTGMLAVTMSVGMITNFSWKDVIGNLKNVGVSVVAFADEETNTGGEANDTVEFDDIEKALSNIVQWKYKDEDENCIYVKLTHDKDLKKIEDEQGKSRVEFKVGTKEIIARYELNKNDKKFKIVDENGDYQWVGIEDVDLNVSRAYKNENGDVIAISMEATGEIERVTYLENENPTSIVAIEDTLKLEENKNKNHPMKHYEVDKGTTGVLVYLKGANTPCEVQLALDWKAPEVEKLYRNASNTRMILKAKDNESGIDKVFVDAKQITIQGTLRTLEKIIESGVTQVRLCDAVGHETIVDAEEDSTEPKVVLKKVRGDNGEVKEGEYSLTIRDYQSGFGKIMLDGSPYDWKGKDPGRTQDELVVELKDIGNVECIYVYDALGNKATIDLSNIDCVIVYTHNNSDGSKIAISLYEDGNRKIDKVGILNRAKECKIIEQMPDGGVQRLLRCYETPEGTTGIRIFYLGDPDSEENEPADYVLDPYEVAPTVVDNKKVVSLVGISRVEYSDGRKVEFSDSMPTIVRIDLAEEGGSAIVYDSLDNCSIVE